MIVLDEHFPERVFAPLSPFVLYWELFEARYGLSI